MTTRKRILTITVASAGAVLGIAGVASALPTIGLATPWSAGLEARPIMQQVPAGTSSDYDYPCADGSRMHADVDSMFRHHDEMVERYPEMRQHMGDPDAARERMRERG